MLKFNLIKDDSYQVRINFSPNNNETLQYKHEFNFYLNREHTERMISFC